MQNLAKTWTKCERYGIDCGEVFGPLVALVAEMWDDVGGKRGEATCSKSFQNPSREGPQGTPEDSRDAPRAGENTENAQVHQKGAKKSRKSRESRPKRPPGGAQKS